MRWFNGVLPVLLVVYCLAAACSAPQQMGTTTTEEEVFTAGTAYVRFIHAVSDAPAVDFYVGETIVASGVGYQQWTEWTPVGAGEQEVMLRRGEFTELTDTYTFEPEQRYLVLAWGVLTPMGEEVAATFMISPDQDVSGQAEDAWIRFANVLADGDALGLVITTGGGWNLIIPNQSIGTISEYKRGPLYQNTFDIIPARDTSLPPVHQFDHHIQVGIQYTFVLAGRQNSDQMDLFAVTDFRE